MKKSLVIGTITLLTMGSASVLASDLTIPNQFVAGTAAKAADVNANFDAVEAAVNTKADASDVEANTALINANTASIDVNTAAIATKANADTVYTKTEVNTALGIKANSVDVYTKTQVDISLDTKANSADVATNTTDIATNTANIAINTAGITGNTTDIADLLGGIKDGTCIGNNANDIMVRVGPVCVDKYEASVWADSDGTTGVSAGTPYGVSSDNYPASFPDNGNWTTKLYAVSKPGVIPSSNLTWFQAQQACAASGKSLLTNAEWQMAAAGTPDPITALLGSDTTNYCNTNTAGKVITGKSTGGSSQCVSKWVIYDMVGNVHEWVADWMPGSTFINSSPNSATYGSDTAGDTYEADNSGASVNNFSAALNRGGAYDSGTGAGVFASSANEQPSFSYPTIGFRCAR